MHGWAPSAACRQCRQCRHCAHLRDLGLRRDLLLSYLLQLLDQIFNLKFTSKQLVRAAKKCEKEEKDEKLKIKKAVEKGGCCWLHTTA